MILSAASGARAKLSPIESGRESWFESMPGATHWGANLLSPLVHDENVKTRKHGEFLRKLSGLRFYRRGRKSVSGRG
jgi:hypothetical protein